MKTLERIAHLQPFDAVKLGHYQDPIDDARIPIDVFALTGDMPNLDRYDAVVMTGTPQSVNDPEMEPMVSTVREAQNREIPVFGGCAGAQAIAAAIGMKVVPATVPEYGFRRVTLTDEGRKSPLLEGFPPEFGTFQVHNEMVFNDPRSPHPDVSVLAEGNGMIQMFEAMGYSLAIQSHPELPINMVSDWADKVPQLRQLNRNLLYTTFSNAYPHHISIAQLAMRNFLRRAASRRA